VRVRLHYVPFMPRTLCGLSDDDQEIRWTPSRSEFFADTYRCSKCARKLQPTESQISLMRWLADGNEPGNWEARGTSAITFWARERVLDALLDRGWVAEDWHVTPSGREVLVEVTR